MPASILRLLALLAAVTPALAQGVPGSATLSLVPTDDATIHAEGDLANGIGGAIHAGRNGQGNVRRALLRFDLSALPPGAQVTAAELRLVVQQTNAGDEPFALHRVTRTWQEGPTDGGVGGQGQPAVAGDVTWDWVVYPTVPWTTPGGDFDATPSETGTLGAVGAWTIAGAGLAADVQAWVDGSLANHGWLLKHSTEVGNQTTKRIPSSESATAADRPELRVTYVCPQPSSGCSVTPNSAGPGAQLAWSGSTSVAADDLQLLVSGATTSTFGVFLVGDEAPPTPFNDGVLCLAGATRFGMPFQLDGAGSGALAVGFAGGPGAALAAGEVPAFQLWFRDVAAAQSGSNTSDLLRVPLCP